MGGVRLGRLDLWTIIKPEGVFRAVFFRWNRTCPKNIFPAAATDSIGDVPMVACITKPIWENELQNMNKNRTHRTHNWNINARLKSRFCATVLSSHYYSAVLFFFYRMKFFEDASIKRNGWLF